ncbi:MAG: helix-turn-helix domain-containing protein [Planctomycetota bacterium]
MNHLSSSEVQELLGIRSATLYAWVRTGKLHPKRLGRKLLFEEEEVLRLLGKEPRVPLWVERGTLQEAKSRVQSWARTGARPHYFLEYLAPPGPEWVRGKVLSADQAELQSPFPGGTQFDALLEAQKRGDYVFLGHEQSVWRLDDVRPETGPSGRPYVALSLVRLREAAGPSEREALLRRILDLMEKGPIRGSLVPYSRSDLHERDPR